jgi:CRISPR/Cas system-associated exonuclease Cas4 (RecB family)
MSNLANEYNKILSYLESHEIKGVPSKEPPRQEPPKPKKVDAKPKKKDPPKDDLDKQREEVKKLMEEASYTYVPGERFEGKQPSNSSTGFDVVRFESLMRTKLIDNYKRMQSYERPYISVTELIGCLRQSFYSRMKYQVDLKQQFNFSYLYLIQQIGDQIHDLILNLYDFTEIEKSVVSEKYKVKGRVDGIRESIIYELKSIEDAKFENKFIYDHYLQALIYAYILNTEYDGYDIKTVTLVYIMRNLKRISPFDIPLDNDLAKFLLSRSPILLSSIKQKTPPDPYGSKQEHCQWCLYKKYCEKDECQKVFQPFAKKQQPVTNKVKKEKKKPVFVM